MSLVLLLLAAVQWLWSWVSPLLMGIAAELLLTRLRRRWRRKPRREAGRARHEVAGRRVVVREGRQG